MIMTVNSHYGIFLETRNRTKKEILYHEDKEEILASYESIRKVHEVKSYKGSDQLVFAHNRVGWMSPKVCNVINRVV